MTRQEQLAGERAEALAYLLLTDRRDLEVIAPPPLYPDNQFDLIANIRGEKRGVRQFAVEVASLIEGPSAGVVDQRMKGRVQTLADAGPYPIPVIFFVFSMRDDHGYYSWIAQPPFDGGELLLHTKPAFQPLDADALGAIVKSVDAWYERRYNVVRTAG